MIDDTGCFILLVGFLHQQSEICMDKQGEIMMTVCVATTHHTEYDVILMESVALFVRNYGFDNAKVKIYGAIESCEGKLVIFADKVIFLTDFASGSFLVQNNAFFDVTAKQHAQNNRIERDMTYCV